MLGKNRLRLRSASGGFISAFYERIILSDSRYAQLARVLWLAKSAVSERIILSVNRYTQLARVLWLAKSAFSKRLMTYLY